MKQMVLYKQCPLTYVFYSLQMLPRRFRKPMVSILLCYIVQIISLLRLQHRLNCAQAWAANRSGGQACILIGIIRVFDFSVRKGNNLLLRT